MKKNNFVDKMRGAFKKVVGFLDKTMFPTDMKCMFCDCDIADYENKPYCDDCERDVVFNNGNKCLICSEPMDNEATVCDFCQKNKRSFKRAFCPFVYTGKVRSAILGYKDSNRRYLAKDFARFIAKEIKDAGVKIDRLTYVPLSDKKRKKRGFDQAELLAKELGKLLDLKVEKFFIKHKDGKMQKFSNFKERQENMVGMYSLAEVKLKKTETILIVDDIITTCATVNYCAALLEKKVKDVYVASIARNKLKEKVEVF